MTPASPSRTCNVLRDGIERAAVHARQVVRHSRGVLTVIVRDDGAMRVYRRGTVPANDEACVIGTYNNRISADTIAGDLAVRLAEIA